MYKSYFVYLFTYQWAFELCLPFGIVNNAAINTGMQISVWVPAFNSFGCIPRGGIAGSYGDSVFNFLHRFSKIDFR